MAVDDDMIHTPYGRKRWAYLKHTMELENWMLEHVMKFGDAVVADIANDLDYGSPEMDERMKAFSETHPALIKWMQELRDAVYVDPQLYAEVIQ